MPPVIPPIGGGGGGYVGANWGNLRHITPKLQECVQEVDIMVVFDDVSFEQHYNVNICNTKARAKATVVTTTNMVAVPSVVTASFVKTDTPLVTASFVAVDK